jgi:hypothetical protein
MSVVNRGFEPRSGQTKEYKIGICCFSAKHAALRRDNVTTTSRFLSSTLPSFILDILNDCVRLSDDMKEFFILN